MKWIKKEKLNVTDLKEGVVIVAMYDTKNKSKIVIRSETIFSKLYKEEVPKWVTERVNKGQILGIVNDDGTYTTWTLSRAHFKNIVAVMFEEDMINNVLELIDYEKFSTSN